MNKRPAGELLFRVALLADTHVNEHEDFSASPYPANAEANARARFVFSRINQSGAAFAIHLGDMVNPVPELPSYVTAIENFKSLAATLTIPLHLMPGNHDIGDKPVSWMPAGMVDEHHVALYRQHFGKDYYSFDHGGCHFVIINAPLINTGSAAEAEQKAWLEADLAASRDKRLFLFSHYPLYIRDPGEPESYDNIDEPGRSWLISLIRTYKPEAVFTAHAHNFWYDRVGESECYVLPSTCFVRHDYSEMYRIDGGDQKGRNDAAKLGYVTLDIYESGHIAHYHRTYGAKLDDADQQAPLPAVRPHTKTSRNTTIHVDMRHAWVEDIIVAPSGAVDEFRRKKARNDYPLMALWEMGLRSLRVPIEDLTDAATRRRMALLGDVGHLFQVYHYGLPTASDLDLLAANRKIISRLELVLPWGEKSKWIAALPQIRERTGIPIHLSRVNRTDTAKHEGGRFNHLISHGFGLEEMKEIAAFAASEPGATDGVQFTIMRAQSPWVAAKELRSFAEKTGLTPGLYVKSTEASPATSFEDDVANAHRFAEAAMAAIGFDIPVILDTFDDADRGYFTRTGLIDRRFNPRLAGQLLSILIDAANGGRWRAANNAKLALLEHAGEVIRICPRRAVSESERWLCPVNGLRGTAGDTHRAAAELLLVTETSLKGALQ